MQVFLLRKTSQVPRERSPFRWCIMFAELFCAGMRFARPSFNYLPLGSAHSQEHRFIKSLKSCVSVCMSRGCIIYLWSSTWAGRCRTPWLTWGCRTPAMKPSTRSDGAETRPQIHTRTFYILIWKYQQPALMFPSPVAGPGHGGAGGDGGGCRSGERRPRQAGR